MLLTSQILENGKSSNGGWSYNQIRLFGVDMSIGGWKRKIIGKDFPKDVIECFLQLRDAHLSNSNTIKPKKKKADKISFTPIKNRLEWKEQYLHPNWQKLRLFVLERDKFTCVNCNSKDDTLHVHHIKYIYGKLIWEVPFYYLVTLCEKCHSEEHGRDLTSK
jgi:hypothetical protein